VVLAGYLVWIRAKLTSESPQNVQITPTATPSATLAPSPTAVASPSATLAPIKTVTPTKTASPTARPR